MNGEQLDIFGELYPKFVIDKPIRLIELFAGIGSQAKALKNLGANFEHWKAIEVDKYAMASYNAVHGTSFETSDITKIHAEYLDVRERERYCYIMTYSFPCQDLSIAGRQAGMAKGSGTRSGLLWEVERLLDELNPNLPQVLLMENVTQVIAAKNIDDFYLWRDKLETLGYQNYVDVLNAKDYEIPQNRNRCFMVSLLGEYSYSFPKPRKLKLCLKDMLEESVDEKYYVSDRGGRDITNPERLRKKYTQIDGEIAVPVTAKGQSNWTGDFISDGVGGISKAVRSGGRGSFDRHTWDLVREEDDTDGIH